MSAKSRKIVTEPSPTPKKTIAATSNTLNINMVLYLLMALLFSGAAAVSLWDIQLMGSDTTTAITILAVLGVIVSLTGLLFLGTSTTKRKVERSNRPDPNALARQRAKAVYDLSLALSSTLDYNKVLRIAQDIGILGIREADQKVRLASAVLLFRSDDDMLHVATSHGMVRNDENVVIPGRTGIIGKALEEAETKITNDPNSDPELRRFVIFQKMAEVLVIPLHASYQNYGVLVFGSKDPDVFTDEHAEWLVSIGTQTTVALQNAVLYQSILHEKERIVAADEEARKKLSRDLHDGPTQTIAMIATRSDIIQRMMKANQFKEALDEVKKVEELALKTTKEIRHMLFTLRPLVLENQGLVPAVQQLAAKMKDTHDCNVVVKAQREIDNLLEESIQGTLFYIIEEAVNNAYKHAQANQITVSMLAQGNLLKVTIQDDGVGFDVDSVVNPNYHERGSFGMVNMRERVEVAGGKLTIHSTPGKGTSIVLDIPLSNAAKTADTARQSVLNGRGKNAPSPTETRFSRHNNS